MECDIKMMEQKEMYEKDRELKHRNFIQERFNKIELIEIQKKKHFNWNKCIAYAVLMQIIILGVLYIGINHYIVLNSSLLLNAILILYIKFRKI